MITESNKHFFLGCGEMGDIANGYDWSQTALGDICDWPSELRTAAEIVLSSGFPMLLWWGHELTQLYNDAFRPSLGVDGKHPHSFGKPAAEYWKENWHIVKPLADRVIDNGERVYYEDVPIPNYRNGHVEEVFWTFSYSPVRNSDGKPMGVLMTCIETTEQVIANRELKASEILLKTATELGELGVWRMNAATEGYYFSERYAEIVGIPQDVLHYHSFLLEIVPSDRKRVLSSILRAQRNIRGGKIDCEFKIVAGKHRKNKIIHLLGQVMFDSEGKTAMMSGSIQDVTIIRNLNLLLEEKVKESTMELSEAIEELQVMNEELAQSNDDLVKSNSELARFAYIASHDLQEPLRKIRIFSGMLSSGAGVTEGMKVNIARIQKSAERMSVLVKDLLDFSRLGNASERKEVELDAILDVAIGDFDLLIEEKNAIILRNKLPSVLGNSSELQQLFYNLISNSLKFVREGVTPKIEISACETPNQISQLCTNITSVEDMICISVKDNGIGFNTAYSHGIFEIFKRLHSIDDFQGSGIGLSICKKIVEKYNGCIFPESKENIGTTFWILLPKLK